ncbi:carotenoid biosynthesis protein [Winogradskyella flava]|uniref:Carotenoid biosynthesis protein n=1 Tax=Winogradskyella flava TaxID=1884876 RepID=A0A842IX87_9FLAO|nr:carotenoid biosynthesis protein [Winogradskyella flava]MBC2845907.1 carotenoid biosynthesis protein [Winogradskyella flava]
MKLSIFIIWLFTISGIFGVLSTYEGWFLSLTPLSLLLSFLMILWHMEKFKPKILYALSIPFFLGFITEALGVKYGLIFGDYAYGENLGSKIFGVPLMICINWTLLTVATADVARSFTKNFILASAIGALLMTGLDFILEVSAPRFDFWEFENGIVPLKNYIGWFVTAFLAHLGYQSFKIATNKVISWHVLISIVVFFAVFLFF